MTEQLAFIDESLRPGRYLLGCAVVAAGDAGDLRRSLHGLLLAGERRLHLQRESKRRRRHILDELAELQLEATVYVCRHREGRTAEVAELYASTGSLATCRRQGSTLSCSSSAGRAPMTGTGRTSSPAALGRRC